MVAGLAARGLDVKACVLAAVLVVAPAGVCAKEIACWFDGDVVVAPAEVAGIPGDYIIDTGAPRTQLHNTRAEGAGIAEPALTAPVRLAGRRVRGLSVEVADLDARTFALPTPVAGVIGADALAGFVLDLRLSPCRLSLKPGRGRRAAGAPPPLIEATVSDGVTRRDGLFVVATGAPARLSLSDAAAAASDRRTGLPAAGEAPVGRLAELTIAGRTLGDVKTAVVPGAWIDPRADGVVGVAALANYRLRFDFPRRTLSLTPVGP